MNRIKQINTRIEQIKREGRSGKTTIHDMVKLNEEKDQLEKELKVLIKTIK